MIRRGASSVVRPADGGRAFNWSALASDSDSDSVPAPLTPQKKKKVQITPGAPKKAPSDTETLLAAVMARGGLIDGDPEMADMSVPGVCWGDLFLGRVPVEVATPAERPLRGTLEEFWAQPFAANLAEYTIDVYDTRLLTDEEWNAMMSWLYWKGWWIDDFERGCVNAEPDDLPARRWCPPPAETPDPTDDETGPKKVVCWSSQPSWDDEAGAKKAPKKKTLRAAAAPVPVMRFCRAVGTCTEAGCRYVHGDTIPKMDRPCGFGAECGASDPTGLKRSQCIYMHPGEEWTADLCIHRP